MSERIVVTQPYVGICHMQVCAVNDATDAEILEVANRVNPSGTQHGWGTVIREGQGAPVPCENMPTTHTHFLVEC